MSTNNFYISEKNYERLCQALEAAGVKKYGRGKKVAEITGYSEARVSEMLSGRIALNDKFKTIVCSKFKISEEFVDRGEGEMFLTGPSHVGEFKDEILEFVLGLETMPELRLLINDMKGKTPDEVLEYVRAGRKALREGKI